MTGFLIFQVSVAGPCDILVCVASVYPAFEGVATFSADYFFRRKHSVADICHCLFSIPFSAAR